MNNKELAYKLAKKCRQNVYCHLKEDCIFSIIHNYKVYCETIKSQNWLDILNIIDKVKNNA